MLVPNTMRRVTKRVAVGTTSLTIIVAAAGYAIAPVSEAIGATVATVAAVSGHSAVEGKILDGKHGAKGVHVQVVGTVKVKVDGKYKTEKKVLGTATIGSNGKFSISVKPGKYSVVIKDGNKSKTLNVTVNHGKSVFVAGTITKHAGALAIAPVVFNY